MHNVRGIDHIAKAPNGLLGLAREEDAGAHDRVRVVLARRTEIKETVKVADGRADGDVRTANVAKYRRRGTRNIEKVVECDTLVLKIQIHMRA